ncbi:MAG: WbqC family protein [Crocinitomicaceae bacterium]|nr:WbqC family protein [Crocinitomicaceae bacterium]
MIILPSTYFGNIEYFYLLFKAKEALIDIHEPYQKQTYRSRCEILTGNGKITLSVPVVRPNGKDTAMNEVLVSYKEDWRKDHKKAIESAYRRTPYYEYYIDAIHQILDEKPDRLIDLNNKITTYLIDKLGLTVQINIADTPMDIAPNDPRIFLNPKKESTFQTHRYIQTFEERFGFLENLSVLDLLFNEGPNSISILQESKHL